MSKESPMDFYFRNIEDMMNQNLVIEQRFDDMMNKMKNMLKGVTEQFNRGGRDNRSGRGDRGGRGNRVGQGNNLFYTSCFIGDYEYELCIDHDEEENLISKDVVKELNLRTERLYQPYYIVVENHRVKVTRYARVPVSIGSYKAVVSCDVVPLSDVHLIFGRSWLSLHNVRHNAFRTRYSFSFGGKRHVLESLPPMKQCDYQIGDSKAMEIDRGALPDVKLVEVENIEPELKNDESGGMVELTNGIECDVCDDDSSLLLIDEFPITKEEQIDIVVKMEDANDTVFVSEIVKNDEALVVDEIVHVDEAFVASHVESVVEPEEILDTPAEVLDLSLLVHDTCNELVSISRESNSFVGAVEHEARSTTSLEHLKDIRAAHIYHDPFLVHCRPFDFVVADFYVVPVHLYKRLVTQVFTYLLFLDVLHYEGLLTYVRPRLLFDPGGFEDESFPTGRE